MLPRTVLLCIYGVGMSLAYDYQIVMPGDIMLGGLFSVKTYGTAHCNQVDAESVQIYEAVRWFLQKLNERSYLTNVTLGLHSFNTCDEPPYAVQATLDMLEMYKNKQLYGILGPGRSSETQLVSRMLSSLPEERRLPQMSYSATAATLTDKSVYNNLLRVIVPDNKQIEVLHQLVLSLQWNYIAIVYEMDTYGIEGASALKNLVEKDAVCVPIYYGIDREASAEDRRISFETLISMLERTSESPVVGVVFFGLGSTAKVMFEYLNLRLENFQLIVSEALGLNIEYLQDSFGTTYPRAKGLLTLSPPFYDPTSFKKHWVSLHSNEAVLLRETRNNNWLLRYMEGVTGCSLENATTVPSSCLTTASASEDVNLSIYISYALTAVAAFAKAMKGMYKRHCPLQAGVCREMTETKKGELIYEIGSTEVYSVTDFPEIQNFNRNFGFKNGEILYLGGDGSVPTYNVYNFRACAPTFCFIKVGDHVNGHLSLSKNEIKSYDKSGQESSGAVEAQCQPSFSCLSCAAAINQGEVMYIPGDFYIIGLAPLHDQGTGALQCGGLRTSIGVDIAESIAYAVKRVNQKRDIFASVLGNKKVGLILIDTCNNPLVARERVIKLERGELQLNRELNSSYIIDKIIGYVGPYGSSVSVPLSSVMAELDKVFISYASTSSTLSSKVIHPTFMRTCSPDYKQANVIMYLAKALQAKYVQIIYTDEEYGKAGVAALQESGRHYKICIAQTLAVPDSRDATIYRKYVSELRRFPHAKVVIIFVRSHVSALLVTTLNEEISSDEFVYIGGESWGKRSAVVANNYKATGSLTLAQELPKNQGFENYFADIYVPETSNPWLRDYLEAKAGCYYPMSFNKISGRVCTTQLVAQTHQTDPWVPFAINAAYAMVLGFNKTLDPTCSGSLSVCPGYTTAQLIKNIKEVRLDIYNDGGSVRVFDNNGEGNVGYTISQIVRDGQSLIYKKVGDSSGDSIQFLMAELDINTDFTSQCQNDMECGICMSQFNETADSDSSERSTVIGLGVFVAILLVVIVVLLVLAFLWCRRNRSQPSKQDVKQDESPHYGYLTVVPDSHLDSSSSYAKTRNSSIPQDKEGYSYPMSGADNPGIMLDNESECTTTGT